MLIKHKKKFGVYHWDTFDNETFLQHEADTSEKCVKWVEKHYGDRLRSNGADQVDLVDDEGNVVRTWSVG